MSYFDPRLEMQIKKSQPTESDVHVNTPLTNMSVAFMQDAQNFVADRVFPNIPVTFQSDRYYTYDRGRFNADEMAVRAPSTESKGTGYTVDNSPTYAAKVWALHKDIDDQVRANSDSVLKPDADATNFLTVKALINRERAFVTNFFTTSIWTFQLFGDSSSADTDHFLKWSISTSTPIEDVRTAMTNVAESTGFRPNTLVLGRRVYDKLIDHPEFVDRVKYGTQGGQGGIGSAASQVTKNILAQIFELDQVLVMDGIYNAAKEGLTNQHFFIGGKHALLCYSAPSPGLQVPSAGYTFSWNGYLGAGPQGQRITKFRMPHLKSDRVEIESAYDQKVISADLGCFFANAVA